MTRQRRSNSHITSHHPRRTQPLVGRLKAGYARTALDAGPQPRFTSGVLASQVRRAVPLRRSKSTRREGSGPRTTRPEPCAWSAGRDGHSATIEERCARLSLEGRVARASCWVTRPDQSPRPRRVLLTSCSIRRNLPPDPPISTISAEMFRSSTATQQLYSWRVAGVVARAWSAWRTYTCHAARDRLPLTPGRMNVPLRSLRVATDAACPHSTAARVDARPRHNLTGRWRRRRGAPPRGRPTGQFDRF